MSDNLIDRLRLQANLTSEYTTRECLQEAAGEIESLRRHEAGFYGRMASRLLNKVRDLAGVLNECDEYLRGNDLNSICAKSILHRRIQSALSERCTCWSEAEMIDRMQQGLDSPSICIIHDRAALRVTTGES